MSGLNFTREEVYCDHEDASKSYSEELRQDWLAMYDLLSDDVLNWIDCTVIEIQELSHPSSAILEAKDELIKVANKIRALIGGGE